MNIEATKKKKIKIDSAPKKKRRIASLDKRKARVGWLFVLPFVIGLVIIYLPIIYNSIMFSFHEINPLQGGGYELVPVGFKNYSEALFVDPSYVTELTSGIRELIFDIPAIIIFALFVAILLNQEMVGRTLFRAIFFIPVIIATGLISDIDAQNILSSYMGGIGASIDTGTGRNTVAEIVSVMDVEMLFANMRVGSDLVEYVVTMVNNIFNIVNRSGVQMLIFLAGLQSISPSIYESCKIDGATGWETFWKITFPMISPMILVNAIYTIIDALTRSDNNVMAYIDQVYDSGADGNVVSSAMAWMYFLIVALLIVVVSGIISAYVFYQRREE
ncbi:MAG TPA: sugar ABC transporter permease [Bacillota bacterium]|nr:sugar ABC transporter permease [Bacillota bacterium]